MIRLTARMRQFVETFVRTGDSHQAVVMAGYSRKRVRGAAYDLLKNPRICAEIERRQKAPIDTMVEKASQVSPEFLVSSLIECLGDIERVGSSGAAMLANRLRCHELIIRCKELQAQTGGEPRPLAGVTDADLEAAIRALDEKLGVQPAQEASPDPEPVPVPDADAPWRLPSSPPSPPHMPSVDPNVPALSDTQRMQPCSHNADHPPYRSTKDRCGRWSECPACRTLWQAGNDLEARHWNRSSLLPADPR